MLNKKGTKFIDRDKLYDLVNRPSPTDIEVDKILNEAIKLKGLSMVDVATLLRIESESQIQKLLETAGVVKNEIYGKRLVLFAPLYIGNVCSNNCVYCGFRKDNKELKRVVLNMNQIESEVLALLKRA